MQHADGAPAIDCDPNRDATRQEMRSFVGASPASLSTALELQRKAQWRLDFVAAQNSMGFHVPQERARLLGEAIDNARQGELIAVKATDAGADVVVPASTTAR